MTIEQLKKEIADQLLKPYDSEDVLRLVNRVDALIVARINEAFERARPPYMGG